MRLLYIMSPVCAKDFLWNARYILSKKQDSEVYALRRVWYNAGKGCFAYSVQRIMCEAWVALHTVCRE